MPMAKKTLDQLKIEPGEKFRIRDHSADWLPEAVKDLDKDERKKRAEAMLEENRRELAEAQELLYADGSHSVLIVFQAMDAAGKDGTIRNVLSGLNPAGIQVSSFKAPAGAEAAHDYLWRVHQVCPPKGHIGVFNRSHYEDVLIVRVHDLVPPSRWKKRYQHIVDFERLLTDEGTTIVKFYLHISKGEQKERLQARLDDPTKNWKFAEGDLAERKRWDDYQTAFTDMLNSTSTSEAPWYVIPADNKWYRDLVVAEVMVQTLRGLDMKFPPAPPNLADIVVE